MIIKSERDHKEQQNAEIKRDIFIFLIQLMTSEWSSYSDEYAWLVGLLLTSATK